MTSFLQKFKVTYLVQYLRKVAILWYWWMHLWDDLIVACYLYTNIAFAWFLAKIILLQTHFPKNLIKNIRMYNAGELTSIRIAPYWELRLNTCPTFSIQIILGYQSNISHLAINFAIHVTRISWDNTIKINLDNYSLTKIILLTQNNF